MTKENGAEKTGAGHLEAMLRKGFKEITPALKAFPDSIQSPEEAGVFGNLTPQEIQETKGKENAYDEWLNARAKEAPEQDGVAERGMER